MRRPSLSAPEASSLECCFSSVLRVNVLLESKPLSQSQISGRLKQVFLKNFPIFSAIHDSFNYDPFPSPWQLKKTSPQHDAVTTMFYGGDGVLGVMRGVGFTPDIVFNLMAKKLNFSLIWPEYLLLYVWGVSHMPFGEHQTFLLICFFKQWLFFWPLFCKAQRCGGYGLKWFYEQILQSLLWSCKAPSGLSLVSLLPLWLMPSLPGLWVLVGGPLLAVLWFHILSIFYNGAIMVLITVLRGMFNVSDIFL